MKRTHSCHKNSLIIRLRRRRRRRRRFLGFGWPHRQHAGCRGPIPASFATAASLAGEEDSYNHAASAQKKCNHQDEISDPELPAILDIQGRGNVGVLFMWHCRITVGLKHHAAEFIATSDRRNRPASRQSQETSTWRPRTPKQTEHNPKSQLNPQRNPKALNHLGCTHQPLSSKE